MESAESNNFKPRSVRSGGFISRDEMNLAEFPLAVLSTRVNASVKTLEFKDVVKHKNGEIVNREWVITGADKFGLPTASDDEVMLGLLKLTSDDGFKDRKVYFTRYELLQILRWSTEGRSYNRLQKALDRLSGVRIKATNAFYDNTTKSHSTVNFGVIDAYEINDGRDARQKDGRKSFFIWSEVLFDSFQSGFIKKLDLSFLLELKSAVSKRLYRYLDKHFWYRSTIKINLFKLAHEKIGVSRNYRYVSLIRQQIDPAISELLERGFLSKCEYLGDGAETEVIFYAAKSTPRVDHTPRGEHTERIDLGRNNQSARPQRQIEMELDRSRGASQGLERTLIERGLAEHQVERLLQHRSEADRAKIVKIVDHFDTLVKTNSKLVSRNPIGFLYRAVEQPQSFILPGEENGAREEAIPAAKGAFKKKEPDRNLEGDYLIARRRELESLKRTMAPEVLQRTRRDVEEGLSKIRGLISEDRFLQAVEIAVEDRLAKMFALSTFDEWLEESKLN